MQTFKNIKNRPFNFISFSMGNLIQEFKLGHKIDPNVQTPLIFLHNVPILRRVPYFPNVILQYVMSCKLGCAKSTVGLNFIKCRGFQFFSTKMANYGNQTLLVHVSKHSRNGHLLATSSTLRNYNQQNWQLINDNRMYSGWVLLFYG